MLIMSLFFSQEVFANVQKYMLLSADKGRRTVLGVDDEDHRKVVSCIFSESGLLRYK